MDDKYRGMTVNERLFVSGEIDAFDIAVRENNKEEVVRILSKVEITDVTAIEEILLSLGIV